MAWVCLHDRPVVVGDGSRRPTCASTILALQEQQEALRAELADTSQLLAEAERTSAALLRAWGGDRATLVDAHEQAVLAAAAEMHDAWQYVQMIEEEEEAQVREVERVVVTTKGMKKKKKENEERERERMNLLRKAAAVLERRWQMRTDASTNTVNTNNTINTATQTIVVKMTAVASQTVDPRYRTAAVQTEEEPVSLQQYHSARETPLVMSVEINERKEKKGME
ncbi:hypothetical protein LSM04_004746 [Trypanosoma melophagium]|uniref:uncharacterized protein n=1 Tax=Trypanosoma melophagium TaxID=715481 RepID=UPI00351A97A8|nr:hypothetical protein LSM04_004746 [Trypanosoma melophagium]